MTNSFQVRLCAFAFVAVLMCAAAAIAQMPASGVALSGEVKTPETVATADLKALPASVVAINFETDHGAEKASYRGALLWTVLSNAEIVDQGGKSAHLHHTIIVTGRDGYAIALALGEIDPKFENKSVILAYAKDSQPLDPSMGIRLIVPGDLHGGRSVRDVVKIELR